MPTYLPKRNENLYPQKELYKNVHNRRVHNSRNLETTQIFTCQEVNG